MGDEWINTTLGEVVRLQRGHDLPELNRISGEVPVMGSFGLTGWHNAPRASGPGVTIGRSGASIGTVSFVQNDYWPLNTCLYVTNFLGNDPRFCYYWLSTLELASFNSGSAQPSLNRNHIYGIPVRLPRSTNTQRSIASVLNKFDEKIELNRQTNQTLEFIAQALFKSWFVDFDPVIDNALAAGNEIPEPLAVKAAARRALQEQGTDKANQPHTLPNHIRQLFPSRFQFTDELGWIPEGWTLNTLADISEKISKGTTPKSGDIESAIDDSLVPFIKVRDIDDEGNITAQENLDKVPFSVHSTLLKRSRLKAGDILFTIAGTIGRVAVVASELHDANANQAVAFVRLKHDKLQTYVFQSLRSPGVREIVASKTVQAVQANVSLATLGSIPLCFPAEPVISVWNALTEATVERQLELRANSYYLANSRDALLPKLLSGELRIPEAEEELDEALA